MATITGNRTLRTLIASATSNAAAGTTSASVDLRTTVGPHLFTGRITNGATGPTIAASMTLNVSGDGSTWRPFVVLGHVTTNAAVLDAPLEIPAATMYLQVVVTGNTAQAVTCEAFLHELTSYTSAP